MSLEFEQQITLDLTVQKVQNVHCSEDDKNSRNIVIQLTDKGKPYNVSDEKLYFKLTKPDGNYVYIDEDDTEHLYKENGKIVIILSDQATAVGGICKAEIQLKKDGKIITTVNFHVIVKKSVLSDDSIVSDIESNVLDKLITHLDNDSIHVAPDERTLWNTVVDKLDKTGDASNVINTFSTASIRTNLTTGEKLSVSLSKISKWFRDLKSIAFSGSYNDLSDKPTLGTASAKDVAATGNASASQVVMGNDTRLSDARKASDVSAWAKASTKPTYTASEVGAYTKTEIDAELNGKANISHTHTKSEVGLGNVDNTADANKSVKYATSAGSAPANGGNSDTVNGHTVKSDVPANAKFTDTTYNDATTTSSGLMSASDKTTIENLKNGAVTGIKGNAEKEYRTGNVNITAEDIGINVDNALSSTSENPVQNKVIYNVLSNYYKKGVLNDVDFNTVLEDGIYDTYVSYSDTCNAPANTHHFYGILIVKSYNSEYYMQLFFYDLENKFYVRTKSTEWTDWEILGLSTSQSTAITTAGTYALDAVQNNASVRGTLANRIKAVEDTVGKVYSKTETVYGSGAWKMSGGLTVPAGTYIITRKGTNINGAGVSLGCGYNALSFVTTPADASTGIYTDIVTYTDSSNSIYIYYCAALNSTINLEIKAVRIK